MFQFFTQKLRHVSFAIFVLTAVGSLSPRSLWGQYVEVGGPASLRSQYRYDQKVNKQLYKADKKMLKAEKKIANTYCPEHRSAAVNDIETRQKMAKTEYRNSRSATVDVYRTARQIAATPVVTLCPAVHAVEIPMVVRPTTTTTYAVPAPMVVKRTQVVEGAPIPNVVNPRVNTGGSTSEVNPLAPPVWNDSRTSQPRPDQVIPTEVLPIPEPMPTPAVRPED